MNGEVPKRLESLAHPEVRHEIFKRLGQSGLEQLIVELDSLPADALESAEDIITDAVEALREKDTLVRWIETTVPEEGEAAK